jgi:hypothetical protein
MLVLIGGMQRSGSTFTFNIARELLKVSGSVYVEASADLAGAIDRSNGTDHVVLKDHAGSEALVAAVLQGTVRTICTVRRVEDALASWMQTFGFDLSTAIHHLKGWFAMYERIQPVSLTVGYGRIEKDPIGTATKIAELLNVSVNRDIVADIAESYSRENVQRLVEGIERGREGVRDIGFSYYHEETFFHRRHISSLAHRAAEEYFSSDELRHVAAEFSAEKALLEVALKQSPD